MRAKYIKVNRNKQQSLKRKNKHQKTNKQKNILKNT